MLSTILHLEITSSPFETETLVEVGYQTFPKQKHTKVMQEKGSTSRNSVQICQVDYIIQLIFFCAYFFDSLD